MQPEARNFGRWETTMWAPYGPILVAIQSYHERRQPEVLFDLCGLSALLHKVQTRTRYF